MYMTVVLSFMVPRTFCFLNTTHKNQLITLLFDHMISNKMCPIDQINFCENIEYHLTPSILKPMDSLVCGENQMRLFFFIE